MDHRNWKRPRNYESLDCSPVALSFVKFENNWELIEERMG